MADIEMNRLDDVDRDQEREQQEQEETNVDDDWRNEAW